MKINREKWNKAWSLFAVLSLMIVTTGCDGNVQLGLKNVGQKYFLTALPSQDKEQLIHPVSFEADQILFNLPQDLKDSANIKFNQGVYVVDGNNQTYPVENQSGAVFLNETYLTEKSFYVPGLKSKDIKGVLFFTQKSEIKTEKKDIMGLKVSLEKTEFKYKAIYLKVTLQQQNPNEWILIPGEMKSEDIQTKKMFGFLNLRSEKNLTYFTEKLLEK